MSLMPVHANRPASPKIDNRINEECETDSDP
jgi:hypothetical protein